MGTKITRGTDAAVRGTRVSTRWSLRGHSRKLVGELGLLAGITHDSRGQKLAWALGVARMGTKPTRGTGPCARGKSRGHSQELAWALAVTRVGS